MSYLTDIDPASDRAVFRQIADRLRDAITSGRVAPGEKLPSESELMRRFGTARATVRQAIQLLRSEGLVVAESGRGVFVRIRPTLHRLGHDRYSRDRRAREGKAAFLAEVESGGHEPAVDSLRVTTAVPPDEIAELLGLGPREKAVVRARRYLIDGHPVRLGTSYLPASLAVDTPLAEPNPGPGGIYARLEETGHPLAYVTEAVTARMPTPDEAHALRLPPGVPVLRVLRVAYASGDRPVEVGDSLMASDVYVLDYRVPVN
jgi:GntR family transcriptional regulator